MAASSKQVMIVGAGATGALTGSLLSEGGPNLSLYMWDKGRGAGGRMSTHRDTTGSGHVDMGAQYITRYYSPTDTKPIQNIKNKIFADLLSTGTLMPFQGLIDGTPQSATPITTPTTHYVSSSGISAVPKFFIERSKVSIQYKTQLESIDILNDRVILKSTGGEVKEVESAILTLPVPQCLALKGNYLRYASDDVIENLRGVAYSSRYALGLFFQEPVPQTSWTGKYYNHDIIRYMCWDSLKYSTEGRRSQSTLLVHSSVPYGIKELENDKDNVKDAMISAVNEILPGLPSPVHSYIIRWRYSQVFKGYTGSPGYVVISKEPLVMITGDAFTHSNLEGCIEAAYMTVEQFNKNAK